MANTRVKFGYLTYDDMLLKIENRVIDVNDIVFTKDTHETYIISSDLTPVSMMSKVYVFDSVSDANTALNTNTDTYKGQIVSVLNNDKYSAYIVNQDPNGIFFATALSAENIDYNTLGNRPIENLEGTLDNPIIVDTLNTGIYKIKGQYHISNNGGTTYLSLSGDLLLVEVSDTEKHIKRFAKNEISDFIIADGNIVENKYITASDMNTKMSALEEELKKDMKDYIEGMLVDRFNELFDQKIQGSTDEEVQNFFK